MKNFAWPLAVGIFVFFISYQFWSPPAQQNNELVAVVTRLNSELIALRQADQKIMDTQLELARRLSDLLAEIQNMKSLPATVEEDQPELEPQPEADFDESLVIDLSVADDLYVQAPYVRDRFFGYSELSDLEKEQLDPNGWFFKLGSDHFAQLVIMHDSKSAPIDRADESIRQGVDEFLELAVEVITRSAQYKLENNTIPEGKLVATYDEAMELNASFEGMITPVHGKYAIVKNLQAFWGQPEIVALKFQRSAAYQRVARAFPGAGIACSTIRIRKK